MFKYEAGTDQTATSAISIIEAVTNLNTAIIENQLEIAQSVDYYKGLLTGVFASNNNIYDASAKEILRKSSLDILVRTKDGLTALKDSLMTLYTSFAKSVDTFGINNRPIIEKYEPALKKLNTSKFSYAMPVYDMSKLNVHDMMERVLNYMETIKSLNLRDICQMNNISERIREDFKDTTKIVNDIKRAVLGVPTTVSVENTFYNLMQTAICDKKNCPVKGFGDDFYAKLAALTDINNYKVDIEFVITIILAELRTVSQYIDNIIHDENQYYRDEFYDSVQAKTYASRAFVISTGVSLICDVIQEKARLANELNSQYINILIDAYSKCTDLKSVDAPMLESSTSELYGYKVSQIFYDECAFGGIY